MLVGVQRGARGRPFFKKNEVIILKIYCIYTYIDIYIYIYNAGRTVDGAQQPAGRGHELSCNGIQLAKTRLDEDGVVPNLMRYLVDDYGYGGGDACRLAVAKGCSNREPCGMWNAECDVLMSSII